MELYKASTKTQPLFFFESFIDSSSLEKYENLFYDSPLNPSQEAHREHGFIKYYKDLYEDEDVIPITEYFKTNIETLLNAQVSTTELLLLKRRDELEYQNTKTDSFIQRQLNIIQVLKGRTDTITVCKQLITDTINKLEILVKQTGNGIIQVPKKLSKIKTNNPYFEPIVGRKVLIKLYDIAIDNRVFDEEVVTQSDFLDVFMSNTPQSIENKIQFQCDNLTATYFLNSIMVLFNNLKHARIVDSKSFYSKGGKLLIQRDLDKAKSTYEKKVLKKSYSKIQKEIDILTNK